METENTLIYDNESEKKVPAIFEFAFCGTVDVFKEKIQKLADLAETEEWTLSSDGDDENKVLRIYIYETFARCKTEGKILFSEDGNYCTFNTGLLTKNCQEILAVFCKNNKENCQEWKFLKWMSSDSIEYMQHFNTVALMPAYWKNYEELYYNPDLDIVFNFDHIIDDNWDRIKNELGETFNKPIVKQMLIGAINETKTRIKRNMRLVVPQFYRDKIMFLVPIVFQVTDDNFVTLALAVEKMNANQYRANTIFTLEMAYGKARQLMKPESNWLLKR